MNKILQIQYELIVIGGGHAGIEAAAIAANMGTSTLLISIKKDKIGLMPCNPSVGGIGKSHIVFEIAALNGLMPKLCSKTHIQARMLNTKKGPAVQGLRLQIDKEAYSKEAIKELENIKNCTILEAAVAEILIENNCIKGVRLETGEIIASKTVVITTGTFLNGLIHIGEKQIRGGRRDEAASVKLSDFLSRLNLKMGRLKTGTPPRLKKSTINFSKLEKQELTDVPYLFEFDTMPVKNSHDCFIAYTNEKTHEIINKNLDKSALFSGKISGIGPRYCPSIEDKIFRFSDKAAHHIFVEPETADYLEVYPSGISTSLPENVQNEIIASIVGFENAQITKFGYAIEYDFVHPDQLTHSLECKNISGLFFAGQINGTTGYEEAAGQGILAGINAALKAKNKAPFILDRHESYIGVMVDDLVNLGVDEPYRMFTSRAERRLILRQDNAFMRLTEKAYSAGIVDEAFYNKFCNEKTELEIALNFIDSNYSNKSLIAFMEQTEDYKLLIKKILNYTISPRNETAIFAHIKYRDYIKRELNEIEKIKKYKDIKMPSIDLIFKASGISNEIKQKLMKHSPQTIADASIIPGITPAALSLLILLARKPELI